MAGMGPTELLVVLMILFGGGYSLPTIGVPHPLDAGLQSATPPECLIYYSSQGVAKADPKSSNQVEQFLAEQEIEDFAAEVLRLVDEGLTHIPTQDPQQQTLVRQVPVVVKSLLARPNTLYVTKIAVPPQTPEANAALVVHAADQVGSLVAALEELEKLYLAQAPPGQQVVVSQAAGAKLRKLPTPPGIPPIVWGSFNEYVFLTVGAGEAESLVDRLTKKVGPPEWLKKLQTELGIKRLGSLAYLNAPGLMKIAEPLIVQANPQLPPENLKTWIDLLGARHLRHVSLAAGLDQTTAVSKMLLAHDGTPSGLLALMPGAPLTKDDLKNVPANADFAMVTRFDLGKLVQRLLDLGNEIDPNIVAQAKGVLGLAEQQLGFRLQDDLLAALGDSWSIYHSAEDGGLLLTGLCGTVSVRDRVKLEATIAKLLRLAEAKVGKEGGQVPLVVRQTKVGQREVSYVQVLAVPFPVAPAWHWNNDRLVFALSPQMLRAHLSRSADAKSLDSVPEMAAHLASGDVTSINYSNVQFYLRFGYSYVQYLATMGAGMLEKEIGVQADLAKFPSYSVIGRHLRPAVTVSRSTPTGILTEHYSTGAFMDFQTASFFSGTAIGMIVPAVQQAREAAQQSAASNNLRQIGLAFFTYEADKGSLPPRAIISRDGKPLLSWRVAILPYLEQKALYDQFHLDEPWDSEHNQTVARAMPTVYAHPGLANGLLPGTTVYQIPGGKGTIYDGVKKPLKLIDVSRLPRGSSGSALIVESSLVNAIEWTKPDDLTLDADDPKASLSSSSRGVTILYADGSVRTVAEFETDELTEALFPRRK